MSFLDENVASVIREGFDRLAVDREYWQKKNRYYYSDQYRFYRFLVAEGCHVLELGCGLGDLLAAVQPKRGLGIDFSEGMVKEARRRHPHLEFRVADVETVELEEKFDVIILSDVI
jgi:ubiquinone/menaquinone biosynthesis C-methylase UbiE